jgi:hypothetical protein
MMAVREDEATAEEARGDEPRLETHLLSTRTLLMLAAVAVVGALLGWWMIGRFAEEDAAPGLPDVSEASVLTAADAGVQAAVNRPAAESTSKRQAPPPEVVEPTIELSVLSDPPAAEVLINDQFRGLTPVTVHRLARRSEIVLRVQLDGYQPWEQRISLADAQPELQITAGLVKNTACPKGHGWIYVTTDPAGASVDLDGKRRPGQTPLVIDKVCAGSHEVLVQAEGRQAWKGRVEVGSNSVHNLNLELKP